MNEIITTNHFDRWLENLRDDKALVAIDKRIHKAQFGNFGKVRFITNGIWEMKIDVSGGYRRGFLGDTGFAYKKEISISELEDDPAKLPK